MDDKLILDSTTLGNALSGANGEITIRRATADDIEAVVDLWIEGQAGIPESSAQIDQQQVKAFYLPYIQNPEKRFGIWVAEISDGNGRSSIAGWQALLPCRPQPLFEKTWAHSSTYINSLHRGRGVGRSLLRFACETASDLGFSHIVGYIRADNAAPIRLVESLGWQKFGVLPRASANEVERLCYGFTVAAISQSRASV